MDSNINAKYTEYIYLNKFQNSELVAMLFLKLYVFYITYTLVLKCLGSVNFFERN